MKINDKQYDYLKSKFNIYDLDNDFDIETWTFGGVDMFIHFDKTNEKTLVEQLKDYIDNFDIDSEIDLYREDESYRNNFTIRESLNDFESWLNYCNEVLETLKELERQD